MLKTFSQLAYKCADFVAVVVVVQLLLMDSSHLISCTG